MVDPHATAAHFADEETLDTDFVHHLVRGADLLKAGNAEQSRTMLERALQLRPANERGQNLLALSYFKLGQYERALEIYRVLVAAHPNDPALRVNLGLVRLKQGQADEAIEHFLFALELAPEHRKAQNYIGLAHLQQGHPEQAREWFERAGNRQMAERVARDMGDDLAIASTPSAAPADDDPARDGFHAASAFVSEVSTGEAWDSPSPAQALDAPLPEASGIADLETFGATHRIQPPESADAAFTVSPTMIVVTVRGDLFTRIDGVLATFGTLDFKPEFKRFRGRITDKPFGEGARRVMRVGGEGRVWIGVEGRHFEALEIGDEAAYFREDALFAFEESLLFENGRVPSRCSSDLQLVHLRGRGLALLVSHHPPRSVEIRKDEPCRLPLEVLLGWHGTITPRIVPLGDGDGEHAVSLVELTGEGRALLDASV